MQAYIWTKGAVNERKRTSIDYPFFTRLACGSGRATKFGRAYYMLALFNIFSMKYVLVFIHWVFRYPNLLGSNWLINEELHVGAYENQLLKVDVGQIGTISACFAFFDIRSQLESKKIITVRIPLRKFVICIPELWPSWLRFGVVVRKNRYSRQNFLQTKSTPC